MSDTIYDWARRKLEAIDIDGRSLDLEHLSALSKVSMRMLDDYISEIPGVEEISKDAPVLFDYEPSYDHPALLHHRTYDHVTHFDLINGSWSCVDCDYTASGTLLRVFVQHRWVYHQEWS